MTPLLYLICLPALAAFIGFDLAFRFMTWRIRQIVRDEMAAHETDTTSAAT